jgi:uncharacterized protein involved in outer membrane biogenesis
LKKALAVVAVLVALVAAGAWLAYNSLDVIVKMALEHWGPDVTGVDVKVGEVRISPRDGQGSIRGLELGSPRGFGAPRALRFGEVRLAIDPATVTSPVIVVHEIAIEAPQIVYEKAGGQANLDAIQKSIEAYAKSSGAAEAPGHAGTSLKRRFIIERLTIRGGRVTMTAAGLRGQGIGFDLPEIELRGIGKRSGGVTASEAAAEVASALQVKIAQKLLTNVDLLRRGGVEGAIDALKGLLK